MYADRYMIEHLDRAVTRLREENDKLRVQLCSYKNTVKFAAEDMARLREVNATQIRAMEWALADVRRRLKDRQ